ncbi:MAG: competence/damage-inducible protein A, partial [Clostridia bacterium]|nr:competence/damage-inducible protein A [Clostridia bacterium]
MNAELICVGSELLSGKIVNTNSQFISKKLAQLGHTCKRQFIVDDNKARVSALVKSSVANCDILIISGGLGPTNDDITKEAVCEALGLELYENAKLKNHIETFFKQLGKTPTQNNFKQATAPKNATIFKNDKGTACGLGIEYSSKAIILLPGPPKELTHMFNTYVVPYLQKFDSKNVVTHTLSVFGMGESAIETALKPLMVSGGPVIATYCKENECDISITATATTKDEAEQICSNTIFKIKSILGDVIYGTDSISLAQEVVNMLRKAGLKIATAESCTGGMLSSSLTSVSGASDTVELGILAYSNRIKNEALSVPQDVLLEEGAISAETAMYLAKNVRILSGADIGVGITGNAGPTAQENKPVGLVYIAIADKNNYCIKKLELPLSYSRDRIRDYATLSALDLVRKYVLARPNSLANMRSHDDDFYFDEQAETLSATVSEEKFAIFEVDENYNFEDVEPDIVERKSDAIIDINSFLTFADVKNPEFLNTCKQFVFKHWIKLVSVFMVLALIISSTVLVSNFTHENHQINLIEDAREQFNLDDASTNEATGTFSVFDFLASKNSDIKAWIKIDGTEIDNPVYQADDNKYYQTHNMLKQKSRFGALFFNSNNTIETDSHSKNLTIYGHNTTNGIMFGGLDEYRSLSFYKNHSKIRLKTLYFQNEYIIFAVFVTNADPDDDNGNIFNYAKSDFASQDEFAKFISEAKKRSVINVPVDITPQDEILTLSTHSDEFDNARFVVMAKRIITPNEINHSKNATLNPNAKYPQ